MGLGIADAGAVPQYFTRPASHCLVACVTRVRNLIPHPLVEAFGFLDIRRLSGDQHIRQRLHLGRSQIEDVRAKRGWIRADRDHDHWLLVRHGFGRTKQFDKLNEDRFVVGHESGLPRIAG